MSNPQQVTELLEHLVLSELKKMDEKLNELAKEVAAIKALINVHEERSSKNHARIARLEVGIIGTIGTGIIAIIVASLTGAL